MNMIDILENLCKMLGNKFFERRFLRAIDEVRHGKRISDSLEKTNLFPQMLIEMISVGENCGNLEEVLKTTFAYYNIQVECSIAKAVALLEPISIIILGTIVYFVVMSVLVPMISMMNAI
jgi:type IV pilus assembly protein PilC